MRSSAYRPVAEDDDSLNSEKYLGDCESRSLVSFFERNSSLLILILFIATFLFASISVTLAIKLFSVPGVTSPSEIGYNTEIASATKVIKLKETVFTGGLKYDEKDQIYREIEPHQTQYVGPASPKLDAAWDSLLAPLGMVLDDKEVGDSKGMTYEEPDGSWLLTLDVYHSLHCVNLVRQGLDPNYYPINPKNARVHRLHTDHCLDYLRQALQCSADLTPLTYLWSDSRQSRYPVFGAEHTCRNFDSIHQWATHRLGNYTL